MADDQGQPRDPPPPPVAERHVRVPEPRISRRTSARSVIFSLFATLFAVVVVVCVAAVWGYNLAQAPGPLSQTRTVIIERGSSNEDVAAVLQKNDVVDNARVFLALIWVTRARAPVIKAGEYEFNPGISMRDALALIRTGRVITYKLTLPEGWTSARILERIRNQPALAGEITRPAPEGSLLPDTYLYRRGMSRDDMIAEMQATRDKVLKQLWADRAPGLPLKTPQEAVILASIVEKETGLAEERPRVAAVFVNRLKRHMRLQSDPTIIYGITEGKSRLDRPLRRSDVAERTKYNTYQINGLPPTPIANPGREALAAVLNPIKSDELYFVADGTGGHVFSTSLKDHQANVKRWRRLERDQRDAAAADDTSAAPDTGNDKPVDQAPDSGNQKPVDQTPDPVDQTAQLPPADDLAIPDTTAQDDSPHVPADQPAADKARHNDAVQTPSEPVAQVKPKDAAPVKAVANDAPPKPEAQPDETPKPSADQLAFAEIATVEPGKIVRISGRLVPFPRPRPPR